MEGGDVKISVNRNVKKKVQIPLEDYDSSRKTCTEQMWSQSPHLWKFNRQFFLVKEKK